MTSKSRNKLRAQVFRLLDGYVNPPGRQHRVSVRISDDIVLHAPVRADLKDALMDFAEVSDALFLSGTDAYLESMTVGQWERIPERQRKGLDKSLDTMK